MTLKQQQRIKELEQTLKEINKQLITHKKGGITLRNFVLRRDKNVCKLCGEEGYLQIHHLTPREFGGENHVENLIAVCLSCHHFLHCNPKLTLKSKQGHIGAIKQGLEKAKKEGHILGRRSGSKDLSPRRKEGYISRWEKVRGLSLY